jgi:hypothetical protein
MRWSNIDELRAGKVALGKRDIKPFCVNRNIVQVSTDGVERYDRSWISWILHPDGVSWIQDHSSDEIQRPLSAGNDKNLLRTTPHPADGTQIAGDRLPER